MIFGIQVFINLINKVITYDYFKDLINLTFYFKDYKLLMIPSYDEVTKQYQCLTIEMNKLIFTQHVFSTHNPKIDKLYQGIIDVF